MPEDPRRAPTGSSPTWSFQAVSARSRPTSADRRRPARPGPAPTAASTVPAARRRPIGDRERPAGRHEQPQEQGHRDGDVDGAPAGLGPERVPVATRAGRRHRQQGERAARHQHAAGGRDHAPGHPAARAAPQPTPTQHQPRPEHDEQVHRREERGLHGAGGEQQRARARRRAAPAARRGIPGPTSRRAPRPGGGDPGRSGRRRAAPGRDGGSASTAPATSQPHGEREQAPGEPRHRRVALAAADAELGGGEVVRRVVDVALVALEVGCRERPVPLEGGRPLLAGLRRSRWRATGPGAAPARGTRPAAPACRPRSRGCRGTPRASPGRARWPASVPATRSRIRSAVGDAPAWPSATASSTRSPVTDEMTSSTAESPVRMSHSKIHIIGGGSRPIARTFCSAKGPMYRPCGHGLAGPGHRLGHRPHGGRVVGEPAPRPVGGQRRRRRRPGRGPATPASTVFSS